MNDADSLLVVDVGSVTTRALLFDIVDGSYRFLAAGTAPTTVGAPFRDVSEGVRIALDHLQSISGRTIVGADERLIMPSSADGSGVDTFAAVVSAGAPLKTVIVGLLEDVSLESAGRLASSTYAQIVECLSLNDRRKPETRIDAIVRLHPDLILIAGGTEGGATQSVLKLIEPVGLACYLMPENLRPEVIFVGNQELQDEVKSSLEQVATVHMAPNIRPTLESEQLDAAQAQLARLTVRVRSRQIPGMRELEEWSSGNLWPSSAAFGRIVRFLSKAHSSVKGVLGVDVGASATTVAAAFGGDLSLGVYPQFGLGYQLDHLLEHIPLDEVTRWLTQAVPGDRVREYLANKALYPAILPAAPEDLAIEQALARQVMRSAVEKLSPSFPEKAASSGSGLLPWFDPIIASGSVLTRAPNLAQSILMLLDGLQPTGVTTLVLDQNHLGPAIGAAASTNPLLAVQILDSNAFLHLGTIISPVGEARPGTPVVRVKVSYKNGQESSLEVKQGTIEVLRLPFGQAARLHVQPLHRFDVGMGGPGRSGGLSLVGGAFGVVIDARGRPLQLPDEPGRRYDLFKKWLWSLGG